MGSGHMQGARALLRPLVHRFRRSRDNLLFGRVNFDGSEPLSSVSGFDRGTPIDRFYIERFLADHSSNIRGHVLEAGSDAYSRRFGGDRITRQDVLHIDSGQPGATLSGDLSDPGTLPSAAFDCILLTQTLQYVFDVAAALANVRKALRPGGTLLATVPAIAPVCLDDWRDSYFWRFSQPSVRRLLLSCFEEANTQVIGLGNLYAATAFLHGAAAEEVRSEMLLPARPEYAIVIGISATA